MISSIFKYKGNAKEWYYKKETNGADAIEIEKTFNAKGLVEDYKESRLIGSQKIVNKIYHNEYDKDGNVKSSVCDNRRTEIIKNPTDCDVIPGEETIGKPDDVMLYTTINCEDDGKVKRHYAVEYIKKNCNGIIVMNNYDHKIDTDHHIVITIDYDQMNIKMHFFDLDDNVKYPSKDQAAYITYTYYLEGLKVYSEDVAGPKHKTFKAPERLEYSYFEYDRNHSITMHIYNDMKSKIQTTTEYKYDSDFFHGVDPVTVNVRMISYGEDKPEIKSEVTQSFTKNDKGVWTSQDGEISYTFNDNGDLLTKTTKDAIAEYRYTDEGKVYYYSKKHNADDNKAILPKGKTAVANNTDNEYISAFKYYKNGQVQVEATNMYGVRSITNYTTDNKGRVISVIRNEAKTENEKEMIDYIIESIKKQ